MLLNWNPMWRGVFFVSLFFIVLASQLFWLFRARRFIERLTTSKTNRRLLELGLAIAYIVLLAYNLPLVRHRSTPTHFTVRAALLEAPFRWWIFASLLAFLI